MYTLCSKIQIGSYSFTSVNEVLIVRSINALCATAKIKVPVSAVLKQKDSTNMAVETAKEIKINDEVEIQLGYNESYNVEFTGRVSKINYTTPLEIECEDAYFLAKSKMVNFCGKMSLKECLQKCGLPIAHAIELNLRNFVVQNKPVSWVLNKLKKEYGIQVFFDMDGKIIAGRAFDVVSKKVKYELRKNVIRDDDLQFQQASDVKLKVKSICIMKDGSRVEGEIGKEGGVEKTLYFYDVESPGELKSLAEQELKKYSRDGYVGEIETFLFPYVEPCMVAELVDPVYSQRDGCYYVEAVETTFGTSGARRKVNIGIAV
ncbi:MAG: hypothetical protein RRX93_07845 [Bacteroidales bacterium]